MATTTTARPTTRFGFVEKYGNAYAFNAEQEKIKQTHFEGPVPLDQVREVLRIETQIVPVQAPVLLPGGVWLVESKNKVAVVRTDLPEPVILNTPSTAWKQHGYEDVLVDEAENLLGQGLQVRAAGLLRQGGVGFVQAVMAEEMFVEGVRFQPFLNMATSIDGTLATTYNVGAQVIWCDNMAGTTHRKGFKIKHTSQSLSEKNRRGIADALGLVQTVGEDYAEQVRAQTSRKISEKVWQGFLDTFAKVDPSDPKRTQAAAERKREAVDAMARKDARCSQWFGTEFGVVQTMSTFRLWETSVRGEANRTERNYMSLARGRHETEDARVLSTLRRVAATLA